MPIAPYNNKFIRNFCIALGALALFGCVKKTSSAAMVKNATIPIDNIICDGDALSFAITANPTLKKIITPAFEVKNPGKYEVIAPDDSMNRTFIRVCTKDYAQYSLIDVIFTEKTVFGRFVVGEGDIVEGLNEAVYGDLSKLRIEMHTAKFPAGEINTWQYYVIRGFSEKKVPYVLAGSAQLVPGKAADTTVMVPSSDSMVLAGNLESKEIPRNNGCYPSEEYAQSKFQLSTAAFNSDFCTHMTSDRSISYRLLKMSVNEASINVAEEFRNKDIQIEANKLDTIYTWEHHNVSDHFVLTLPFATYEAKTFAIWPGAPRQSNLLVTYANGTKVASPNTKTKCAGVLFCIIK